MKPLHIMIDCDDVLNLLTEDWVHCLNQQHGVAINPQGFSHAAVHESFPLLTREEVKLPLRDADFAQSYTVRPGSAECIQQMLDDGHEVSIVTAHNNRTAGYKFEWVTKNFPMLTRDDVIITRKKQKIRGDVLIDDAVKNLEGAPFMKILFNHPNNHGYDASANGMFRVHTLNEAYELIKKELTKC